MKIRYFDNAATTRVKDEVLNEMLPYFSEQYGNPSSLYSIGRSAKKKVEEARKKVANLINCNLNEIYFTGCGSESDNTAIKGIAYKNRKKGNHIITSKIEHPAVLETCKELEKEGFEVSYISVDKNGTIDLEELKSEIRPSTILISVMFANNEIGTIEPIKEIGKIAKENEIYFHTDAVQAVGNIKIDVQELNIDSLSLSGHKFYGPKGIGALYVKSGVHFKKYIDGGHQERNKRAGTENIAGIVGLAKAIELADKNLEKYNSKLITLRDFYFDEITKNIPNVKINGSKEKRLPGNANVSFKNINGEQLLLELDSLGICASSGSACTSGQSEPSHVLTAIGLNAEYIQGSLRTTFGEENTKEDVEFLIKSIIEITNKIGKK